jgi:hypothetical protein
MATQTTYYNFNKPAGTDLVNPLVDTNPNWDALDADLHEFNERSIANCTEVVSLGVHAISRLDTTAKFLKWIATANFTAGDTFVVDGNAVAAATPAGAALATDAYVSGSVVLACLNSDNTAMTIFVSGTNVASDSARLGGELPSYYATDSDMTAAETDIGNLQALVGNTSIVGIGDGTCTGAISDLSDKIYVDDNFVSRGTITAIGGSVSIPADCNEVFIKGTTRNGFWSGDSIQITRLNGAITSASKELLSVGASRIETVSLLTCRFDTNTVTLTEVLNMSGVSLTDILYEVFTR